MAETRELRDLKQLVSKDKEIGFSELHPEMSDNVTLERFLVANKGNVKRAFDQYKKTIVWRKAKIDPCSMFLSRDPINNEYFGTRCLQAFHGIDKKSRPLIIERTGHMPYDEMLSEMDPEKLFERHIWQMEELARRCRTMSKVTNTDIHQFVLILDLADLKIQMNKDKMNMFKNIQSIDSTFYPETLGQIFILNAPMLFKGIWAVLSPFIDQKTKTKIRFLTGYDELYTVIDKSQLPVSYGGTCDKCRPGYGCLPDLKEPYLKTLMKVDGTYETIVKEEEKIELVKEELKEKVSENVLDSIQMKSENNSELEVKEGVMKGEEMIGEIVEKKEVDEVKKLNRNPPGIIGGSSWSLRKKEMAANASNKKLFTKAA